MTTPELLRELLGLAGFATNVAGNLLLAGKSSRGWAVRIVSNAFWLAYSWESRTPALVINAAAFFAINAWGWAKWKKAPG